MASHIPWNSVFCPFSYLEFNFNRLVQSNDRICDRGTANAVFCVVGGVFRGHAWLIPKVSCHQPLCSSPGVLGESSLWLVASTDDSGEDARVFFVQCPHTCVHTRTRTHTHERTHTQDALPLSLCGIVVHFSWVRAGGQRSWGKRLRRLGKNSKKSSLLSAFVDLGTNITFICKDK